MQSASSTRLTSLDAARGVAMLLVCLAHFLDVYLNSTRVAPLDAWLVDLAMLVCRSAAPTFVLVSGVLLGYQLVARGARFYSFRTHLLDRALFLALIGHTVMALCVTARSGFVQAMTASYITDTLAFCVIVGSFLAPAMSWHLRLISGIGLCAGNWLAWVFWVPEDPLWQTLKNIAVGPTSPDGIFFWFPLLPWLGMYLAGSAIGSCLAHNDVNHLHSLRRRFLVVALTMMATAAGVKAVSLVWASLTGVPLPIWIYQEVSPFQKYPPGPLYLLLYGGVGLFLLKVLRKTSHPIWLRRCVSLVEPIGRNSLPVFMAQYFVYYTVFYLMANADIPGVTLIAAGFLPLSLAGVWGFAKLCQQHQVSQFLTTGLPRIMPQGPQPTRRDDSVVTHRAA